MPLATIQTITEIIPCPDYKGEPTTSVEIAKILGWEIIVKKDKFKAGDLCIYIETDSILPEKPEFEFLRNKNFRIKTIKMRGVYSQGICFPLSILPSGKYKEGQDVTNIIGVEKYEKPEPGQPRKPKFKNWFGYLCWKIKKYFIKPKNDSFPTDLVSKTDEIKIQNCPHLIEQMAGKECCVTVKHDGSSGTFINDKKRGFLVCSRNRIKIDKDNAFWTIAEKYNIKSKLNVGYDIQGEVVGPKIQGNSETLKNNELRVFNIHRDKKTINYDETTAFCTEKELPMADLYYRGIFKWTSVKEIMDEVDKAKYRNGKRAEGLVFRLVDDPNVSFKAVSPAYCLKNGE